ncbi:MAG: hypothetical protein QX199_04660 [Methylococcaceae bacterium]
MKFLSPDTKGLIDSVVIQRLQREGCVNLLLASHTDLELVDAVVVVDRFLINTHPDYVLVESAGLSRIRSI